MSEKKAKEHRQEIKNQLTPELLKEAKKELDRQTEERQAKLQECVKRFNEMKNILEMEFDCRITAVLNREGLGDLNKQLLMNPQNQFVEIGFVVIPNT